VKISSPGAETPGETVERFVSESPPRVWRAPLENYGVLTSHSLAEAIRTARATRARLDGSELRWGAGSLGLFRRQIRTELAELSSGVMSGWGISSPAFDPDAPLIATGHQPEFFHPGVWAKNIAASRVARGLGASAWNLIVDNDLLARAAVAAPAGTVETPRLVEVPFDTPHSAGPWEEAAIQSPETFSAFNEAVRGAMQPWGIDPIGLPPLADLMALSEKRLAQVAAKARIEREAAWNCRNRELPLSVVGDSAGFRLFAAVLLRQAAEFRAAHNAALDRYRWRHKVRNAMRPMPDLQVWEGRVETPFWIWKAGATHRGRLFIRWRDGRFAEVYRDQERIDEWDLSASDGPEAIAEALRRLSAAGWKIRTRALTTTLFARLCLCDLFLHGIGGALYDEVTDDILRTWLGLEPPPYMVLTATLRLPIAGDSSPALPRPHDLRWRLRDQQWNPERYLPDGESAEALGKKLAVVERMAAPSGGDRTSSSLELAFLRTVWRSQVESSVQAAQADLARSEARELSTRRLGSRDFAWPLHPRANLEQLWERIERHLEK